MGAWAESKFFSLGPFDQARFDALSKGLEVAIVSKSALERTSRIDAEFFQRAFVNAQATLAARDPEPITNLVSVSDGNHFTISNDFVDDDGIPYFRGQDISGEFFLDGQASIHISRNAYERKYMRRSHLAKGDVLLSIVGTIGSLGLIDTNSAATCSCKLAILRPHRVDPAYLAVFLRSHYGALRIQQLTRGAVQRGLILEDMDQIGIARFSALESEVVRTVQNSRVARDAAANAQREAEEVLIDALGLRGWSPSEPLNYARSASEVIQARRLDAQYYMPAKTATLERLSALPGRPLAEIVDSTREMFDPGVGSPDAMVRNYDLTQALEPILDESTQPTKLSEIDSQKKRMRNGDLAVSRLRSYLREIAVVRVSGDLPIVGSSEFYVLRSKPDAIALAPEALLVYLRSSPVQIVLKWCQDGSQHPRFSERDLLSLPVPDAVAMVAPKLTMAMQRAFAARSRSRLLLAAATRAVEVAVEKGETAALASLAQAQEALDAATA